MSDDERDRFPPLQPPERARRSLAMRLAGTADRARRIATRLGVRPYRVFLVWTVWGLNDQGQRGDGYERDLARVEIRPTPLVKSLDGVSFSLFHAGTIPVGSVSVGEISARHFTEDELRGFRVPIVPWQQGADPCSLPVLVGGGTGGGESVANPYDFFWEVVEDGRHDLPPSRKRFRLLNTPFYRADSAEWTVMLERSSADRERGPRGGVSPFAPPSP